MKNSIQAHKVPTKDYEYFYEGESEHKKALCSPEKLVQASSRKPVVSVDIDDHELISEGEPGVVGP